MKAILWTNHSSAQLMAQVLDRPHAQHIVEQLVMRGVTRIEFYLRAEQKAVSDLLGDGTRWGIPIVSKTFATGQLPADLERELGSNGECVLLGDAACLPALPPNVSKEVAREIYFHDEERRSCWTGWALMRARDVAPFVTAVGSGLDWREAMERLSMPYRKIFLDGSSLLVLSAKHVLEANRRALDGAFPGLLFDGVEAQPGIWVARAATIPKDAVLERPCYIGEGAWIGNKSRIGPHGVVARDCVIEKGTTVCRSVVSEGTYLGPELEVADSLVVRNRIENVRWGTSIDIGEDHVASALTAGPIVPRWMKLALAPILVLTALVLARFI